VIYFIKSESGHVKIGCSKNDINIRIAALQCASPFKLTLLKTIPGDYEQENLIHKKFKKYRFRGEWFILTADIIEFIDNPYILKKPLKPIKKIIEIKTEPQQSIYNLVKREGGKKEVAHLLGITPRYVKMLLAGQVPSDHLRKLIKMVLK